MDALVEATRVLCTCSFWLKIETKDRIMKGRCREVHPNLHFAVWRHTLRDMCQNWPQHGPLLFFRIAPDILLRITVYPMLNENSLS